MKPKIQKVNKADWKEFCGGSDGCGAALTECDRQAEQCTNCRKPLPRLDVFEQRVYVPGAPVVVTRAFLYDWLKEQGADMRPTGKLNSWNWVAWGGPSTFEPLTDEKVRDKWLRFLAKENKRNALFAA